MGNTRLLSRKARVALIAPLVMIAAITSGCIDTSVDTPRAGETYTIYAASNNGATPLYAFVTFNGWVNLNGDFKPASTSGRFTRVEANKWRVDFDLPWNMCKTTQQSRFQQRLQILVRWSDYAQDERGVKSGPVTAAGLDCSGKPLF